MKTKKPVWDCLVFFSPARSLSTFIHMLTPVPRGSGAFVGIASDTSPWNYFQLHSLNALSSTKGTVGSNAILELYFLLRKPKMCNTASKCPSLGIAVWGAVNDTLVIFFTCPILIFIVWARRTEKYHPRWYFWPITVRNFWLCSFCGIISTSMNVPLLVEFNSISINRVFPIWERSKWKDSRNWRAKTW